MYVKIRGHLLLRCLRGQFKPSVLESAPLPQIYVTSPELRNLSENPGNPHKNTFWKPNIGLGCFVFVYVSWPRLMRSEDNYRISSPSTFWVLGNQTETWVVRWGGKCPYLRSFQPSLQLWNLSRSTPRLPSRSLSFRKLHR